MAGKGKKRLHGGFTRHPAAERRQSQRSSRRSTLRYRTLSKRHTACHTYIAAHEKPEIKRRKLSHPHQAQKIKKQVPVLLPPSPPLPSATTAQPTPYTRDNTREKKKITLGANDKKKPPRVLPTPPPAPRASVRRLSLRTLLGWYTRKLRLRGKATTNRGRGGECGEKRAVMPTTTLVRSPPPHSASQRWDRVFTFNAIVPFNAAYFPLPTNSLCNALLHDARTRIRK